MSDLSELLRDTEQFDQVLVLALLHEAGLVQWVTDEDYPKVITVITEGEDDATIARHRG
jgi:hypothetical protein